MFGLGINSIWWPTVISYDTNTYICIHKEIDSISNTWQGIAILSALLNKARAVNMLHLLKHCELYWCSCGTPQYSNHTVYNKPYVPQAIQRSKHRSSLSSFILIFSKETLPINLSSNLFPSCSMTCLPPSQKASSSSTKPPSSFDAQLPTPSAKLLPSQLTPTFLHQDEIIELSQTLEADEALLKSSGPPSAPIQSPSCSFPKFKHASRELFRRQSIERRRSKSASRRQ